MHSRKACPFELRRETPQQMIVERRIAVALQDEIAAQHALLEGGSRQKSRMEGLVGRPRFQRRRSDGQLRERGRRQACVRIALGNDGEVAEVDGDCRDACTDLLQLAELFEGRHRGHGEKQAESQERGGEGPQWHDLLR